jgi:uncharacterized membrane protein
MGVKQQLVYAIFPNEEQAGRAVKELVEQEYSAANIVVLMRDGESDAPVQEVPVRTKTWVRPSIAIGATLGAVGGALVAVGGGLLAAGPLVAVLQGAAGGGAAGTIAGTVGGLGYWRDVIDFPERESNAGAILVGVDLPSQGQPERARDALKQAGATEVHVRSRSEATEEVRHA